MTGIGPLRRLAAAISHTEFRGPLIEGGFEALRVHAIMHNGFEPALLLEPNPGIDTPQSP